LSKHRDRQFFIARSVFGLSAAILVALVGWIAVRAGGPAEAGDQPVLLQPSADLRAAESTTAPLLSASPVTTGSPTASRSASPSPSASASASATPSKSSASPSPSKTSKSPKPSPSRTSSPPPPPNDLNATYATGSSWDSGFIATVQIANTGSQARDFTVTLTYPSGSGVSVRGTWNVSASVSGNQVTLHGNSVAAGRTVTVGFQGGKTTRDKIAPTGCAVGGGTCRVS
jgi:hypothetical protein